MKRYLLMTAVAVCIIILISCDEEFSPSDQVFIYQVPGCKSTSIFKIGSENRDSCFTYSFTENLVLDFCVNGNCCPDSNRFKTSSSTHSDSIIITIADTAQNLCRCNCSYTIRAEFKSLTRDEYFVTCILQNNELQETIYSQVVKKVNR